MNSFKQLVEAKTTKNVHMTHIEDRVLYGGVTGAREAIFALRGLRDMLAGNISGRTNVTVKWDGAPAVFAGIDPNDGQFFVAKKGIFNKDPKVYKSYEDIDRDTSGDLSTKLKIAFDELKNIGIRGVVQGDLMFTKKDLQTTVINGIRYVTFQPNTIVYAVPFASALGRRIRRANLGIVFHTSYSGSDFEKMKASYNVNVGSFKQKKSVWFDNANVKDLTGTANFTSIQTNEVTAAISTAGKIFQQISGSTLRDLESNPDLAGLIETFNNSIVRKGERIVNTGSHVGELINWFKERYAKELGKRSSERGREAVLQRREETLSFFSTENRKNLVLMFDLMNAIVDAKLIIIRKLDELKRMKTFVLTKNGFKVTGQEGFVAINDSGGAVKLVDRLEFSYNNFSPDTIKGWQR